MIWNGRWLTTAFGACVVAFTLCACSDGGGVEQIKIDGSSTVYPITEAVAEEFLQKTRGQVQVTVGVSGTGGGFARFCRGESDINDASRPISPEERQQCAVKGIKYIELPVALDALTVVVNPKNEWLDAIAVEQLKTLWQPAAQGKITRWNQVDPAWPDAPLHLYGPGPDSGTFDYFTETIVGEEGKSRGDFTASEDDNVLVQGISGDKSALGYFGYAYYDENREILKALAIDDGEGEPVAPSVRTARDGSYQPLARPVFIYVSKKAAERKPVKQFVKFYLNNVHALVTEVGYVPLPNATYRKVQQRFARRTTGSVFEGAKTGNTVDQLLRGGQSK
jgi:phosphate transport system substrate-binding protein